MFQRFTDQARRSVVLAQEESRLLRHDYIGPEHVLLGILAAGASPAATALADIGFVAGNTRNRIQPGPVTARPAGHIPFTTAAKKALELALGEALQLDHGYIGAEHLMLGLLKLDDFPIETLAPAGSDLVTLRATLRAAILRAIAAAPAVRPTELPPVWTTRGAADDPRLRSLEAMLRAARQAKDEALDAREFDAAVRFRDQETALQARQANALRRFLDTAPPAMVRGRVFICYRPTDAEGIAGRIHDALVAAITPAMVVMDAALTQPEHDPAEATMTAVATSEFVLVVIGPSWLDSRTPDGRRRIDLVDDEVRLVLLAAEGRAQQIIPVLVHQAELPMADDLPPAIAGLARAEPVRLGHLSFAADLTRLLHRIGRDAG